MWLNNPKWPVQLAKELFWSKTAEMLLYSSNFLLDQRSPLDQCSACFSDVYWLQQNLIRPHGEQLPLTETFTGTIKEALSDSWWHWFTTPLTQLKGYCDIFSFRPIKSLFAFIASGEEEVQRSHEPAGLMLTWKEEKQRVNMSHCSWLKSQVSFVQAFKKSWM